MDDEERIRQIAREEIVRHTHTCRVCDMKPEDLEAVINKLRPRGSAGQKLFRQLFDLGDVELVDQFMQRVYPIIQSGGTLRPSDITDFLGEQREIFSTSHSRLVSRRHVIGAVGVVGGLGYMGVGGIERATRQMGINEQHFDPEKEPSRRAVQVAHDNVRSIMPEVNVASGALAVLTGYQILASAKMQEITDAINAIAHQARRAQADVGR